MNTPSHVILNLAILHRRLAGRLTAPPGSQADTRGSSTQTTAIILGSLLPDAALFVFYGWARFFTAASERQIWGELYYGDGWQDIFAVGNSIPLALAGLGLALWRKHPAWVALFASMVLHHGEDLPLHNEDAHRHFFPFSDVRVISPVSYWDADHFGAYAALGEAILVMVASVWLWRQHRNPWGRGLLLVVNSTYLWAYSQFYLGAIGP
jgi:membrane-bound metal-dependent hydrolase YbcI (DUF457 family)